METALEKHKQAPLDPRGISQTLLKRVPTCPQGLCSGDLECTPFVRERALTQEKKSNSQHDLKRCPTDRHYPLPTELPGLSHSVRCKGSAHCFFFVLLCCLFQSDSLPRPALSFCPHADLAVSSKFHSPDVTLPESESCPL